MTGLEFAAVGVVVYVFARFKSTTSVSSARKINLTSCNGEAATFTDAHRAMSSELVREKLLELNKRAQLGDSDDDEEDERATNVREEEEVFGSGMWGVDFHRLRYEDETVRTVSLYEETIKPRWIFPVIHPYVLCETPQWIYVFEKWRDGVAVSRFRTKELAISSRGKWFGQGHLSQRRMPHLVQSTNDVEVTTTELLVWCMKHPQFRQYRDNCHTFAGNLCKKVRLNSQNTAIEEWVYETY